MLIKTLLTIREHWVCTESRNSLLIGQTVDTRHDSIHRVCVMSADCCHTAIHMMVYRYALKPRSLSLQTPNVDNSV